eukprot:m.172181 g.172181  ORF g.172181 m.172181 type:complete len:208 (+) comp10395_c0_seq24:2024-2647(+)
MYCNCKTSSSGCLEEAPWAEVAVPHALEAVLVDGGLDSDVAVEEDDQKTRNGRKQHLRCHRAQGEDSTKSCSQQVSRMQTQLQGAAERRNTAQGSTEQHENTTSWQLTRTGPLRQCCHCSGARDEGETGESCPQCCCCSVEAAVAGCVPLGQLHRALQLHTGVVSVLSKTATLRPWRLTSPPRICFPLDWHPRHLTVCLLHARPAAI